MLGFSTYSALSSIVRICRHSGRSRMQSIFAIAATALSIVDVKARLPSSRQMATDVSGWPGCCRREFDIGAHFRQSRQRCPPRSRFINPPTNRRYCGARKSLVTCRRRTGKLDGRRPSAPPREMSDTTATAVGSPPAPCPEKTTSPRQTCPLVTTIFWVPCDHAIGDVIGTSIGATRACATLPSNCARDTCRMVQFSSFA